MNSIKKEITAATIAAEIRLLRAEYDVSIVLLEGATDIVLFRTLFDQSVCSLHDCYGRENVMGVLTRLEDPPRKVAGVFAILDADYGHVLGNLGQHPNVCVTDLNDIECVLLKSPAWSKILSVHGSSQKIEASFGGRELSVTEAIISEAIKIGRLRLAARRMAWALDFDKLRFPFKGASSIEIDFDELIRLVIARSKLSPRVLPSEVVAAVEQDLLAVCDGWYLCNGHDLCRVASRALRSLVGSANGFEQDDGALLRALILAYELQYFETTSMCSWIKDWQVSNAPYRVLRAQSDLRS